MTRIWPAILAFLLWAAFALVVHQYFSNSILGDCAITHNQTKEHEKTKHDLENASEIDGTNLTEFAIRSLDGTSIFNFPKGFSINSFNGNIEVPNSLIGIKDSIYNYLNANQDKELLISAKYLDSEINKEKDIDFGKSRVTFLKDFLVKAGINPDRIIPKTILSEFSYDKNGNYHDGISMLFQNISTERLTQVEEGISNKILYSNFAAKGFKPDKTLKAYTIELKNYLQKYPDKKVYVKGHTDDIGDDNYEFGLARANNVKNYLISQGIPQNIIEASSKGETEPVATNETNQGRSKNRRIEITIK